MVELICHFAAFDKDRRKSWAVVNVNHKRRSVRRRDGTPQTQKSDRRKDLLKRLNRIEGQVRGVKAMVEDERYCVDILNQVSAVQAALNSFSKVLLSNHIKTCVVDDIEAGNGEEAVEELCKTIQKLMK